MAKDAPKSPSITSLVGAVVVAWAKGRATMEDILVVMDPILQSLASRYTPYMIEDGRQEAAVAVWKAASKMDLTKPETAGSFLVTTARNAMIDYSRKNMRHHKVNRLKENAPVLGPEMDFDVMIDMGSLSPLMAMYLKHITEYGSMQSAHAAVARSLGVTPGRASTMFHKEAAGVIARMADKNQETDEE